MSVSNSVDLPEYPVNRKTPRGGQDSCSMSSAASLCHSAGATNRNLAGSIVYANSEIERVISIRQNDDDDGISVEDG